MLDLSSELNCHLKKRKNAQTMHRQNACWFEARDLWCPGCYGLVIICSCLLPVLEKEILFFSFREGRFFFLWTFLPTWQYFTAHYRFQSQTTQLLRNSVMAVQHWASSICGKLQEVHPLLGFFFFFFFGMPVNVGFPLQVQRDIRFGLDSQHCNSIQSWSNFWLCFTACTLRTIWSPDLSQGVYEVCAYYWSFTIRYYLILYLISLGSVRYDNSFFFFYYCCWEEEKRKTVISRHQ